MNSRSESECNIEEILMCLADALDVQVDVLRSLATSVSESSVRPVSDLTVADIAKAHGKSPSTVRSWLQGVPGVYRLGQELRISREDWRAYLDSLSSNSETGEDTDLGEWREER